MKSELEVFLDKLCKRCGKCCIVARPKGILKKGYEYEPCPYLDQESKLCRIYPERIHKEVAPGHQCVERIYYPWNIPGCPYNREGYKIHPYYREAEK